MPSGDNWAPTTTSSSALGEAAAAAADGGAGAGGGRAERRGQLQTAVQRSNARELAPTTAAAASLQTGQQTGAGREEELRARRVLLLPTRPAGSYTGEDVASIYTLHTSAAAIGCFQCEHGG